jgi:hypothetical protein
MKLSHLIAIAVIFVCTSIAWWLLGGRHHPAHEPRLLSDRRQRQRSLGAATAAKTSSARYTSSSGSKVMLQPAKSDVKVKLAYQPVKMGLLWHRTYGASLKATYTFTNSTAITQNFRHRLRAAPPASLARQDQVHPG